ncbi:MAG TPA: FAD-dependent oxidoreductase [Trueperaceae bacterium]|nr:FAD-dependent oxidoreductase [Trueperaceae bacterium]
MTSPRPAVKPLIVAVDDDPAVLAAVSRDLRRHYGESYRVVRADSGARALELVQEAKLRGDDVALFLADQRMPRMSGLEFLEQARELYPDARRVLLTAYADTEASIRAINETQLHYYLMKPWDPPEERLYPVLDDLLDDWRAQWHPAFTGVTVVGHAYAPSTHALKDFLTRNLVPYRWLDVELSPEAEPLLKAAAAGPADLPVVVLPDGAALLAPELAEVAARVGLKQRPALKSYDLVIVGAGPGGLAAAVYGASEGLATLLVEAEAPGGQAGLSSAIENYLGFPSGLSGGDLTRRAVTQARRFGAEILNPVRAVALRREDPYRIVTLSDGSEVAARAVLIATGVAYRRLDAPGADELAGAGVYYGAAVTEAMSVKDRRAFVVGAGNSAGQAAMYLSRFASEVVVLVRGSGLAASMSSYLIAQLEANERVKVRCRTVVAGLHGQGRLERVTLRDLDSGQETDEEAAAVFVFIGASPHTEWLPEEVARDPQGYVLAGEDLPAAGQGKRERAWLETSVPGVFVAGDVRYRSVKRIASAVGEGAMAVQAVHRYLAGP